MEVKPLSGYSIIKTETIKHETKTGIIFGFQDGQSQLLRKMFPDHGTVVEGKLKGSNVYFARWGAREIEENLIVINDKDILMEVKDDIQ